MRQLMDEVEFNLDHGTEVRMRRASCWRSLASGHPGRFFKLSGHTAVILSLTGAGKNS